MRQKIKELTSSLSVLDQSQDTCHYFLQSQKANKVLIEYKRKDTLVVNNHQESLNAQSGG